jgi:hypothetical protein
VRIIVHGKKNSGYASVTSHRVSLDTVYIYMRDSFFRVGENLFVTLFVTGHFHVLVHNAVMRAKSHVSHLEGFQQLFGGIGRLVGRFGSIERFQSSNKPCALIVLPCKKSRSVFFRKRLIFPELITLYYGSYRIIYIFREWIRERLIVAEFLQK